MSASNPSFFFSATQSVSDRVGELFSFTWASYAGLRELWWQSRGFHQQFPDIPIKEVQAKFLSVPAIPGGVDFQKVLIGRDWATHEREFAKSLVFNACTLYESWAESVCGEIFSPAQAQKNSKNLQFPINPSKSLPNGYLKAIADANVNHSSIIKKELFPNIKNATSNCWQNVNDHLVAYRYFKECRNSLIHSSGLVNNDTVAAHAQLVATQGQNTTAFRHQFEIPTPIPGEPIPLSLRDATLFTTVVRRLIHTFDAALCVSAASEAILQQRVKNTIPTHQKWQSTPTDPAKLQNWILRLLSASRVPKPSNTLAVATWLKKHGII